MKHDNKYKLRKVLLGICVFGGVINGQSLQAMQFVSDAASTASDTTQYVFGVFCGLARGVRNASVKKERKRAIQDQHDVERLRSNASRHAEARRLKVALYNEWYEQRLDNRATGGAVLEQALQHMVHKWTGEQGQYQQDTYNYQIYGELLRKLDAFRVCLSESRALHQLVDNGMREEQGDKELWQRMEPHLKNGARDDILYCGADGEHTSTWQLVNRRPDGYIPLWLDIFYSDTKIGRGGMVLLKHDPDDEGEEEQKCADDFEIVGSKSGGV